VFVRRRLWRDVLSALRRQFARPPGFQQVRHEGPTAPLTSADADLRQLLDGISSICLTIPSPPVSGLSVPELSNRFFPEGTGAPQSLERNEVFDRATQPSVEIAKLSALFPAWRGEVVNDSD